MSIMQKIFDIFYLLRKVYCMITVLVNKLNKSQTDLIGKWHKLSPSKNFNQSLMSQCRVFMFPYYVFTIEFIYNSVTVLRFLSIIEFCL